MGHMECSRNVTQVTVLKSRCEWEDNVKMDLNKWDGREWTGFIWLRTGTSCEYNCIPSGRI